MGESCNFTHPHKRIHEHVHGTHDGMKDTTKHGQKRTKQKEKTHLSDDIHSPLLAHSVRPFRWENAHGGIAAGINEASESATQRLSD